MSESIIKSRQKLLWFRLGFFLGVHLLETLAFVPQVQHPVIEKARATVGVGERQIAEPLGEFVALRYHCSPPARDFVQIIFSPDNLDHELADGQQLPLQPHRGLIKGNAKLRGQCLNFLVELSQCRLGQFLEIRLA